MITLLVTYVSKDCLKFIQEIIDNDVLKMINQEEGCLCYEYYSSIEDKDKVLLLERWQNQQCLDKHHDSIAMNRLKDIKKKYDIETSIKRFDD